MAACPHVLVITQKDLDDTQLLYQLHLAKVPLLLFQEKGVILL